MNLHVARKDHQCTLCREKIPKGDKYWREYTENYIEHRKEHTNCELYRQREYVA